MKTVVTHDLINLLCANKKDGAELYFNVGTITQLVAKCTVKPHTMEKHVEIGDTWTQGPYVTYTVVGFREDGTVKVYKNHVVHDSACGIQFFDCQHVRSKLPKHTEECYVWDIVY